MKNHVKKHSHALMVLLLMLAALATGCVAEVGEDIGEQSSPLVACAGQVTTSGSAGLQTQSRFIGGLYPDASAPADLLVSISSATTGAAMYTQRVSFGSMAGVVVKAGTDCGLAGPDQEDCALSYGQPGWQSQSANERVYSLWLQNTSDEDGVPVTRVVINGLKYLEIWGAMFIGSSGAAWQWSSGAARVYSDFSDRTRLIWGGYANGSFVQKPAKFTNNACYGRN